MTNPPVIYVESDLRDGVTLVEWRRSRRVRREPVRRRESRVLALHARRRGRGAGR